MQIYIHDLQITLTGGEIIQAILEATDEEITALKELLNRYPKNQSQTVPQKEKEVVKFSSKKCPYCKHKFNPNSGAQEYCSEDHKKRYKKEFGKRRKKRHLAIPKKVATLPVNKPVMIEKEPPIVPARRSHSDYISLAEGIN